LTKININRDILGTFEVDGKSKSFLFLPSKGEKNKKQMGFGWFKW
jgi:hypothetical protein